MPDRKIKRQRHPAKSFSKSPLSVYFLAPSCLSGYKSIMQNKPNFKIGKIDISTATVKAYANEQRTMSNQRYPKQTQSNPIPPSLMPSPNRITASRPMESRRFYRYRLKTLQIRVFSQKTEDRAVVRDFIGRPQDMARSRGTFFESFAAGSMFPIL